MEYCDNIFKIDVNQERYIDHFFDLNTTFKDALQYQLYERATTVLKNKDNILFNPFILLNKLI